MDIWKPVHGFPKYVVSPEGVIKNRERNTRVKSRTNNLGHRMTNLMGEDIRHTRSIAPIVAQAYLPPPRNEAYDSVIHLDGDRNNCEARNLMWRPRWYAIRYHQMFNREPLNISVEILDTGEEFGTLREACVKYGLEEEHTRADIYNGDRCFHYGYRIRVMQ